MEHDKVIEAIITISEYCKERKFCSDCPLSNTDSGMCLLRERSPNYYINMLAGVTERKTTLVFKERK